MTVIPQAWRDRLTDHYLTEVLTVVLALSSATFGTVVIAAASDLIHLRSFQQAFAWAPPYVWGLVMVVLGAFALGLLFKSRLAASTPMSLLAVVWVAWTFPIFLSPGFAWTAVVAYFTISAIVTIVAVVLGGVPRRKG